ncbi:hypothetical protein RHGRI_034391 [Rhododendron griersonianum]|uniref:Glycine-rich protein n=1 Tax=Rhododendron griersonianum TaxID=479676 RepID=A0AAV6I362_9ERIC|nr:hypothetical protein RHGRI_034391 [Rhododendron griersonianum]
MGLLSSDSHNRGFKDGSRRWWSPMLMVVVVVAGVDGGDGVAGVDRDGFVKMASMVGQSRKSGGVGFEGE